MDQVLEEKAAKAAAGKTRFEVIDCDIHPYPKKRSDMFQFLSEKWRNYAETYGTRGSQPFLAQMHIPRVQLARLDSTPDEGPAGSDLGLLQEQLLDFYDIKFGVLQPFGPGGGGNLLHPGLANAICRAVNEWQIAYFLDPEPRLKGSLVVPQEDADAAVAEIERYSGDSRFVQVALHARSAEPLGRKRYWPIYEAAIRAGLPVAIHSSGYGQYTPSGAGWPSFYLEEHHSYAHTMQTAIISLIMEGAFERFPGLRFAVIEGGFAWVPSLAWRLDKIWARNRSELWDVPHPPSHYMQRHVWYATQPVEEPERLSQVNDVIDWIGADRFLFATDYPHWDMDDPRYAFKTPLDPKVQERIFSGNARELYNLG